MNAPTTSSPWLSTTCRVCLASDREMYRLANTALEETYDRVTSGKLVVKGRPCCVCGVCLSALRRCRRFIDTAREANNALDRWIQNHSNTDTKLVERPLFSFTRSPTKLFEIMSQSIQELGVKQERDSADNVIIHQQNKGTSNDKGNIPMEEIKYEVTSDVDNDNTQKSDNIECHNSQVLSNSECINVYDEMIDIENNDVVKFDIWKILDNVGDETAPGASNVVKEQASSDDNVPSRRLRSKKRVKLNEDTESGPAPKKWRLITSEHRCGNTNPAATLHNEGNTISCRKCNYRTTNKYHLKVHLKIHTLQKSFACDKCGYKCSQKTSLKRHLLTHTDEKSFSCDKCHFKCYDNSYFKRHILPHTGENLFSCDKCGYKCRSFSCDKCDYKCRYNSNFKRHLLTHTGEKPLSCEKCDFKCIDKKDLKRHNMTHTGEKPFSCDKCGYKCNQKSNLKLHLLTHSDEKPFCCDRCGYKCRQKNNLQRHLLTHSGEKPYSCDNCEYKCSQKNYLKKHLLTH